MCWHDLCSNFKRIRSVYYHSMIDGFLSAWRHNQLSDYGWEFDNLWVYSHYRTSLQPIAKAIRASVTSQKLQWGKPCCWWCQCQTSPAWPCCCPAPLTLPLCFPAPPWQGKYTFGPMSNFIKSCSHHCPFQVLKGWYQRKAKHSSTSHFVTGNHTDKATKYSRQQQTLPWKPLEQPQSFLEKISQV